jgi:hypothetical protein
MSRKRIVRILATLVIAASLLVPAATSGADAECLKECRKEYQECVDLCKQYVKNEAGVKKCIEQGCKVAQDDCFNDCK